ncbi:uncharacterized protein LOC129925622 isoform X2 [Biomphalaria glabrata]|uniref:Uncharacterized protein LOC129925622 isoform X2 n=1 Tax=Biomphalaria glabrata TaxID=6526 RepID=A0A9W3A1W9_BIOGL|nr:uncharacterized protein LOC129925622 isoform X2 [Biomphalaria glabrata]
MKVLLVCVLVLIGSIQALDTAACASAINACVQSLTSFVTNIAAGSAACKNIDSYFQCVINHGCSMDAGMKRMLVNSLNKQYASLNCNFSVEDELKSSDLTTLGSPAIFDTTKNQGETKNYGNSASSMSSTYFPLILAFSVFVNFP